MTSSASITAAITSGNAARAIRAIDGEPIHGSEWHEAVIRAGVVGLSATTHGAPDRWDWGATFASLERAFRDHGQLVALAKSLTPAQRSALWTTDDPRAARLRDVARWLP